MTQDSNRESRIVDHRTSGVICHVTSLPGRFGIGDIGPQARRFVDVLAEMGQGLWQVLPLGPTGYGESPYMCLSAFAGNPLLISPETMVEDGLLDKADIAHPPRFERSRVDYPRARQFKVELLEKAHRRYLRRHSRAGSKALSEFCAAHAAWLDDYALFMAAKEAHNLHIWSHWDPALAARKPGAMRQWRDRLADRISLQKFVQWVFFRQWEALRAYCHARGVEIIGDIPMYVAYDSADVWAAQKYFRLDKRGMPVAVAGVPPDYFSKTGQRWGNPIYRWNEMRRDGYRWWADRFRMEFAKCDILRIDHFRGFEGYWQIPAREPTAVHGRWVKGPGARMFEQVRDRLARSGIPLRIIAEDLGVITPQVDAMRDRLGFPGMRILQVAFGNDNKSTAYQPHNYIRNCVVYTATHDHNTTVGWFTARPGTQTTQSAAEIRAERKATLRYCGSDGTEIHWDFIKLAQASVAMIALYPLQDVLGLGTESRMNRPGQATGNWAWRFTFDALTPAIRERLAAMTRTYERWTALPTKRCGTRTR
jgi:4-alpha-glucanotransferase